MLFFIKEGEPLSAAALVATDAEFDGVIIRREPPHLIPSYGREFRTFIREYFADVLAEAVRLGLPSVAMHLPPLTPAHAPALLSARLGEVISRYDVDLYIIIREGEEKLLSALLPPEPDSTSYCSRAPIKRRQTEGECVTEGAWCSAGRVYSSVKPDFSPPSLVAMLRRLDDSFAVTLMKLIDARGMTDVECYKASGVSRQTWHKIMNDGSYRPSKRTVLSFAIGLRLNYEETQALLETVGFTLSRSLRFDVIVGYFIREGVYDLFVINGVLYANDLELLGG